MVWRFWVPKRDAQKMVGCEMAPDRDGQKMVAEKCSTKRDGQKMVPKRQVLAGKWAGKHQRRRSGGPATQASPLRWLDADAASQHLNRLDWIGRF